MKDNENKTSVDGSGPSALLSGFTAWVERDEDCHRENGDAYCRQMWFPCLPPVGSLIFPKSDYASVGAMEVVTISFWECAGSYVIQVSFDEDEPLEDDGWKIGLSLEHWDS